MERPGRPVRPAPEQPPGSLFLGRRLHQRRGRALLQDAPRRASHHAHMAGAYPIRYAPKASWRKDNRHVDNVVQARRIVALDLAGKPSVEVLRVLATER
jgi:hypothetical protein